MPQTAVRLLAGVLCTAALGACGQTARPAAPVHLEIQAPGDGNRVTSATVTVSGTVSPAARTSVVVLGHPVPVHLGRFSTQVRLSPGGNIIDILAGAPHAVGAATAIRVTRLLLVEVPPLSGESPAQATAQLARVGLRARVRPSGNPFEFLIPFSRQVCGQSPPSGRRVTRGTTVTLQTGKLC
jgi:hypothetical protein